MSKDEIRNVDRFPSRDFARYFISCAKKWPQIRERILEFRCHKTGLRCLHLCKYGCEVSFLSLPQGRIEPSCLCAAFLQCFEINRLAPICNPDFLPQLWPLSNLVFCCKKINTSKSLPPCLYRFFFTTKVCFLTNKKDGMSA